MTITRHKPYWWPGYCLALMSHQKGVSFTLNLAPLFELHLEYFWTKDYCVRGWQFDLMLLASTLEIEAGET